MTTNSSVYTDDVTGITFKRTVTFVWLGPQSQLLTSTEAPTQPGFRVFHASDFVHLSLIHTSWTLQSTLFDGTVLQIIVETVVPKPK